MDGWPCLQPFSRPTDARGRWRLLTASPPEYGTQCLADQHVADSACSSDNIEHPLSGCKFLALSALIILGVAAYAASAGLGIRRTTLPERRPAGSRTSAKTGGCQAHSVRPPHKQGHA